VHASRQHISELMRWARGTVPAVSISSTIHTPHDDAKPMQRFLGPSWSGYGRRLGRSSTQELIWHCAGATKSSSRREASDDAAATERGASKSFSKKGADAKKQQQQASAAGGGDEQKSKQLKIMMSALDAPEDKEPPISAEEKARRYQIGRNYVIGRFQQNNRLDHDMTCKIYMKKHAIRMLPKNSRLREEALKISDEDPPTNRNIPLWTPPIPGFDAAKYTYIEDEED
jgi:hypothetical protein